jgi:hypothetical protein
MRSSAREGGVTNAAAAAAVAMMMHEFVWRIVVLATHALSMQESLGFRSMRYGLASNAVQPTARCSHGVLVMRWRFAL